MKTKKLTIDPRYSGPGNYGNGGYVSGMLANISKNPSEVTLRKPIPLSIQMDIEIDGDLVQLTNAESLIASVKPGNIDFKAPTAPDYQKAVEASKNFIGFKNHPFPTCFVCGTDRKPHDGLCIFPGHTEDKSMVAAPWEPSPTLGDSQGNVRNEFIWSALDCPGAFAIAENGKQRLLGRMTVLNKKSIQVNEKCVIIGWFKENDGRKNYTGTAIYSESKGLCAVGHSIWIDL